MTNDVVSVKLKEHSSYYYYYYYCYCCYYYYCYYYYYYYFFFIFFIFFFIYYFFFIMFFFLNLILIHNTVQCDQIHFPALKSTMWLPLHRIWKQEIVKHFQQYSNWYDTFTYLCWFNKHDKHAICRIWIKLLLSMYIYRKLGSSSDQWQRHCPWCKKYCPLSKKMSTFQCMIFALRKLPFRSIQQIYQITLTSVIIQQTLVFQGSEM